MGVGWGGGGGKERKQNLKSVVMVNATVCRGEFLTVLNSLLH